MEFFEKCPECDGKRYVTQPLRDVETLPANEWCDRCNARGRLLTVEGLQLIWFVAEHLEDYRDGKLRSYIGSP